MATAAELQVKDKIFIGGEWIEPSGSERIEVVNPTTEEVMGTIPACSPEDADRAVAAQPRRQVADRHLDVGPQPGHRALDGDALDVQQLARGNRHLRPLPVQLVGPVAEHRVERRRKPALRERVDEAHGLREFHRRTRCRRPPP